MSGLSLKPELLSAFGSKLKLSASWICELSAAGTTAGVMLTEEPSVSILIRSDNPRDVDNVTY